MNLQIKYPEVGFSLNGKPKPFTIQCNGKPFAGFDTRTEADKAFNMYSDERKSQSYTFTLLEGNLKLREVSSAKKSSTAKKE